MVSLIQTTKPIDISKLDFAKIDEIARQIEEVYNFERDVATAKAQNPEFDKTVAAITDYITKYRGTYKDESRLRDYVSPMDSAIRSKADREQREFEAVKMALDAQKTKFEIRQSEAVAAAAEATLKQN